MQRRAFWWVGVLAAWGAWTAGSAVAGDDGPRLTFFGWSDQHIATSGEGGHAAKAVDAMNELPGVAFPDAIGGVVERPAFVFGCGDITEWPTRAARDTYDRLLTERLKFPAYDVAGNHDTGGKVPSPTILDWLRRRHGDLSYTWEAGGVRMIAVYSEYDDTLERPAQPLTAEALAFLRNELQRTPQGQPVIVATHLCYDAITNRDALVDALGGARVLMVLGGHYHLAKVDRYRDVWFVQLPSPAPGSPSEVTVVRITPERMVAIPYDYERREWVEVPRKVLDAPLPPAR